MKYGYCGILWLIISFFQFSCNYDCNEKANSQKCIPLQLVCLSFLDMNTTNSRDLSTMCQMTVAMCEASTGCEHY